MMAMTTRSSIRVKARRLLFLTGQPPNETE
jgi:hypothetical protein